MNDIKLATSNFTDNNYTYKIGVIFCTSNKTIFGNSSCNYLPEFFDNQNLSNYIINYDDSD